MIKVTTSCYAWWEGIPNPVSHSSPEIYDVEDIGLRITGTLFRHVLFLGSAASHDAQAGGQPLQWQNPVELHRLVEKEIEMGQPIGREDIPQGIRSVAEKYGDLGTYQDTSTLAEHFWSCSQARRRTTWEARCEDSKANLAYSRSKCQPGSLSNDEVPAPLDVLTTRELNRLFRQYIKGMYVKLTRQEWDKEYISLLVCDRRLAAAEYRLETGQVPLRHKDHWTKKDISWILSKLEREEFGVYDKKRRMMVPFDWRLMKSLNEKYTPGNE